MSIRLGWLAAIVGLVSATMPGVKAQVQGAFRWQLQPYCNVLTLTVRQDGEVATLDGFDDQCGAPVAASVVGTAFLNPDGTIGLGLSGATAPGAAPVMLSARLNPATVSGTWSDSAGNSGSFVFTPGTGTGGPLRPIPANGIRPGSITGAQFAPGTIGAVQIAHGSITAAQLALGSITGAQIAPGSITQSHLVDGTIDPAKFAPGTVQVPIVGTCPIGRYLRGVTGAGEVICEPFFAPTVSTTADDPANEVGADTSIAIGADGLPVISHFENTAATLRVTKCGNPSCTAGNLSTTMAKPVNSTAGHSTSIAIGADGLPIISHQGGGIFVTHCGNAACSDFNQHTTLDTDAGEGEPSIAIAPDRLPVISYGGPVLRVTKCGNSTCTAGNVSTSVDDPASSVGYESSIAIGVDGLPVISHWERTRVPRAWPALRVTKCGNAACTSGNISTTVDALDDRGVGGYSSIAIGTDGLPVISHQSGRALRVTKCGNPACTADNVSTTVDGGGDVGWYTSIAIGADGLPVISHQNGTAWTLRVTKCGNAACTAGNVTTTVDDPVNSVGQHTSIAIGADGLPVISHRDLTAGTLRVTKCGTQSCR